MSDIVAIVKNGNMDFLESYLDESGWTPDKYSSIVGIAIQYNKLDIVKFCVKNGYKPKSDDLYWAASYEYTEMVKFLESLDYTVKYKSLGVPIGNCQIK